MAGVPAVGMSRFDQVRARPRMPGFGLGARAASARGRVWARCAQHPRVTRTCPREPPPASRFLPPPAPESCRRGDPRAPAPWGASPAFSVPRPEADVGAQTGRPFSPIFSQTEQRPGSGRRRPSPFQPLVSRGAECELIFSRVVCAPDGAGGRHAGGGPCGPA